MVDCTLTWIRQFSAQQTAVNVFVDLDTIVKWLEEQSKVKGGPFRGVEIVDMLYAQPLLHRCLGLGSGKAHSSRFVDLDEGFANALRHAMILFLSGESSATPLVTQISTSPSSSPHSNYV